MSLQDSSPPPPSSSPSPLEQPYQERSTFVLRLRPLKGVDPIRALRWVLKNLLRQHGLRALSVEQERKP
jgi:hypothetical protein